MCNYTKNELWRIFMLTMSYRAFMIKLHQPRGCVVLVFPGEYSSRKVSSDEETGGYVVADMTIIPPVFAGVKVKIHKTERSGLRVDEGAAGAARPDPGAGG